MTLYIGMSQNNGKASTEADHLRPPLAGLLLLVAANAKILPPFYRHTLESGCVDA